MPPVVQDLLLPPFAAAVYLVFVAQAFRLTTGGGPGSKGAAGLVQDAVVEAGFDATIGAGEDLTQLGLSAGEVTFSSGLTGAEFAFGVGEAKLLLDLGVFGAGLASCAR